jgi:hypothetical protein
VSKAWARQLHEERLVLEYRYGQHCLQKLLPIYGDMMSKGSGIQSSHLFDRQCRLSRESRGLHDGAWFIKQAKDAASAATLRFAIIMIILIASAVCLSGCATLHDFNSGAELAWQAAHLVDVLQTEHGAASDVCYYEGDPVTSAIIGKKPNRGAVAAWGIGFGGLHYIVTDALQEFGWERVATMWEAATIIDTADVIGHNYSIGIRIGAANKPPASCPYRSQER